MTPPLLLGIDIGTSRIKANLVDLKGRTVALGAAPTPFERTADGIEMSLGPFMNAVRQSIRSLEGPLVDVVGVGIASMGETGTLIGPDGPRDLPLIAWHDGRGAETVERIRSAFGPEIRIRTGREARSVTSIAKLGWLADNGVDTFGSWVGVSGLVAWVLTGAVAQETLLAATSGAFSPFHDAYDPEILSVAGLISTHWPRPLTAGETVGLVHASGSHWSGLPIGIPVTIAGHDHPVGVVGAGATEGDIVDSLGTGEPVIAAWHDRGAFPQDGWLDTECGGDLTVTRWPGSTGLMLLWETLRPGVGLDTMLAASGMSRTSIEASSVNALPAIVVNSVMITQLEDGVVPVELLALEPARAWASVLNGYASVAARAERAMRNLTGVTGPTVLIGGGLRSRHWLEAKRSRAPGRVLVSEETEAVSRGAAMFAGVSAGVWDCDGFPAAMLREITHAEPDFSYAGKKG